MEFFKNANYDFIGWRWVWLTISAVTTAGALILLFALGKLNVGIDFAGGTQLTVRFAEQPDVDELRSSLAEAGFGAAQIQRFGAVGANEVIIKTPVLGESTVEDQKLVMEAMARTHDPSSYTVLGAESVGAQVGSELRTKGLLAVLFSILGMLAYIWMRFELRFGIGAVVALVHDVLITLGLYALAGFEFNLTTIAAFLTVIGYSINDAVVIFDRVRENMRRSRRDDLASLLNRSINQTLSRTVLTGGSVLLVLTSLFFLGGPVIQGFAFVLLVGVIVGTYSTIFVASPIVLLWEQWFGKERRAGSTPAAPTAQSAEPAGQRAAR
jgi:preprotein translocase subunit SecF